jgi:hypothetical protein
MQDLGWELDYSEASVQTLENMITAQFGDWRPWKPAKKNRPIASLVGAYLGEVMILHIGGSWGWMPEFDVPRCNFPLVVGPRRRQRRRSASTTARRTTLSSTTTL